VNEAGKRAFDKSSKLKFQDDASNQLIYGLPANFPLSDASVHHGGM